MADADEAQRRAWRTGAVPPTEWVGPDLWSVPVPIPDNPLRYTLSYVVGGDTGLVVVDPGWDSDTGWDALVAGLAATGASAADVTGIVATHVHADHHGLSTRLQEASGAWVAMHPAEADSLPPRPGAAARPRAATVIGPAMAKGWLGGVCGAPADEVAAIMTGLRGSGVEHGPHGAAPMAEPDVLLSDGDLVPLPGRRLRALWTPGHTPGHLCLVDEQAKLVLSGDHVLPTISPNIGPRTAPGPSNLGRFLESLARVGGYADHHVLPAHQYRFAGLGTRAAELAAHHEERCTEILDLVAELGEPSVWELAEGLTWSRPWAQIGAMRIAAVGETVAHLEYLVERGRVHWDGSLTAGGGPARVRALAAA